MRTRFGGIVAALALAAFSFASPAQAAQFIYQFVMDGPSESPANASPATGLGFAVYDDATQDFTMSATFSGLIGTVSQTHFHGATGSSGLSPLAFPTPAQRQAAASAALNASIMVGNTTLPGFPLGVQSGVYANTINLNTAGIYNVGYLNNAPHLGNVTSARDAFVAGLAAGRVYWNIHTGGTGGFPGGEIRGFADLIPEPATGGLAAIGFVALAARRRRK
jgi:hypothetical protein